MPLFAPLLAKLSMPRPRLLHLRLPIALALLVLLMGNTAQTEPEVVRLWTGGMTPQRLDYEATVIDLALQKSTHRYGPYKLVLDNSPHSPERAIRDLRIGEEIHITTAPVWPISLEPDPPMLIVPVPLTQGLLGYRRLVVRKDDVERFTQISSVAELQEQVAGLGRGWTDVEVFKQAGFKVTHGEVVDQLYTMLVRERFDYFPLSFMEIDDSLASSEHSGQLSIVPNLIIYYPLPIYVQVSREHPHLAERLHYGLKQAQKAGTLDALFDQHYGELVTELQALRARIVELENPVLPEFAEHSGPELLPKAERLPATSD